MSGDQGAQGRSPSEDRRWRYLPVIVIGMNTLMIIGIIALLAREPGDFTLTLIGLLIALAMMNALAAVTQQQYKLILRLEDELMAGRRG